jgi:hypothetical protein
MDYKKMWNTLKAESGYRLTKITLGGNKKYDQSISHLMEDIELRASSGTRSTDPGNIPSAPLPCFYTSDEQCTNIVDGEQHCDDCED